MTNRADWKLGASTCFYRMCSEDIFQSFRTAGVQCIELSQTRQQFYEQYDFVRRPMQLRRMAENQGLSVWSIHLPFSGVEDISMPHDALRNAAMETDRVLIGAAAEAGIPVAVVHPSSEPIEPGERRERMARCAENLAGLQELAASVGVKLAVENLPRTCLGRSRQEIFALCCAVPGLMVAFDTNHLLGEYADPVDFVRRLGSRIVTLHVSDYDYVDERHLLPGDGLNPWEQIITALEQANYTGPWMYEVSSRSRYLPDDLGASYRRVIQDTARKPVPETAEPSGTMPETR